MTAGEPHREVSRSLGGEPPHYLANILMERGWPHGTKGAGGDPTFPGGLGTGTTADHAAARNQALSSYLWG